MLNRMKKIALGLAIAALTLTAGTFGTPQEASAATKGIVDSQVLNIRTARSTAARKLRVLHKGDKVTLLSTDSNWVTVRVGNKLGYTQGRYIKTAFGNAANTDADAVKGTVATKRLAIRAGKHVSYRSLKTLKKGDPVKVLTTNRYWVVVKSGNTIGYAQGKFIETTKGRNASNHTTVGEEVVAYALKFLGNPYVYGGSNLYHGTDCSGFTMRIFEHFGKSLPHSSGAQRSYGRRVAGLSSAKPGDLICYSGHVAIYMGNNRIVHASNPKNDICTRNNAAYRHIVCIRRIVE